jgi:hypothetical protein
MTAGVAAIPAGILYAIVVATGWERWWTIVPLVGLGFVSALFAWKYVQIKFELRDARSALYVAYNARANSFGARTVGMVAATSFVVLCAQPPLAANMNQPESLGYGDAFVAPSRVG